MSENLLDLVRQYGAACATMPMFQNGGNARGLFDRIAALIPQQPVQARNFAGHPWWLHGCGSAWAASGQPRIKCPSCDHNDGPWRPLLVGGEPAPEQPEATHDDFKRLAGIKGNSPRHLLAQVMAELGVDRPQDVLITIKKRAGALTLAQQPAEPGPLRLTLPEVPPGTVALRGIYSEHRYTPGNAAQDENSWYDETTCRWYDSLGEVFAHEPEGVTVELAGDVTEVLDEPGATS